MKRAVLLLLLHPIVVSAEPRLQAGDGKSHFEALINLMGREERTLAEQLASAKHSWALGVPEQARAFWDDAFARQDFQGEERAREGLARAIMELQEANFDTARAHAERAADLLTAGNMRAQLWMVVGEALTAQGANSQAEIYYRRASEEASGETKNEAMFSLGECQFRLGMLNDARYSFASVQTRSLYAGKALRRLMEIDLSQRNYEGVLTWASEGRESAPSEFDEAWVSYAQVTALLELDRSAEAAAEVARMKARYSAKDNWFTFAEAAFEARTARARFGGAP